ncbi:phytoene/squalene synthase family protein [Gemmatimonadota bacterium]
MGILKLGQPPKTVSGVHSVAEEIAAADLNNLYMTSCFFSDPEKYSAFCAFYAVMRVVDDRIDDLPSRAGLSEEDRRAEHDAVQAWEEGIAACYAGWPPEQPTLDRCGHDQAGELLDAVAISLRSFRVPSVLWEDFFRAMHRDIDRPRFETWREFLRYTEGASVAPTTIYLFLLASRHDSTDAHYRPPESFAFHSCGYHLGIFAYLGHIVRDLAEDLGTGREGLLYFAHEDMEAHGVTERMLFEDLARRRASPETRALVADLSGRAREHLGRGRGLLGGADSWLEQDCLFILELIITIYERVIDKIESCSFDPLAGQHRLSGEEKRQVIQEVASSIMA